MIETRFKDTEIGRIPEEWEVVHISDLAQNFTGLTYSPDNVREYGTLVLRSSNIQNGKLCYNDNVFVDMVIPERTKVKKNDILVCVRNGSARLIGKCAIIDEVKAETAFGAFMTILRSKSNVNPYFVHYIWQSSPLQKQVQDNLGATINQITNKDIDNFVVSAPTKYEEQSRIASALTSIDNLISSLDKLIEKKKNIKQGTMQQLLTGKKRLKGFSEPWVNKSLGSLGFFDGISVNPFLTPDELFNEYSMPAFDEGQKPYASKGSEMLSSRVAISGEVLLINKLNVRQKRIWYINNCESNAVCSGEFLPYKSKDIYMPLLRHILLTDNVVQDFIDMSTGTSNSQRRVRPKNILDYEVYIPSSMKEQFAIGSVLDAMDKEISALQIKKAKYESMRQGMMQQLLTGKIRLV